MKIELILVLSCLAWTPANAQKREIPSSTMLSGKDIYTKTCMTCHQVDGAGAPNMIPTLIKSNYVLGDQTKLIKIVLNGLKGQIKVNGDIYEGEMPAHADLKDEEIAAVLTYVRNSFGNIASAVSTSTVRKIRAASKE